MGPFFIKFNGSDPYNNTGAKDIIIQIIKKSQNSFPYVTIISIIIVLLILILIIYAIKKRFLKQRFSDIKQEIEEVKKLQNEAATKYYKKGSISRQTYDILRKEHTERLAELKKDKKKMKKPKKEPKKKPKKVKK